MSDPKVVWQAAAVAEHPEWVQLTDDGHPLLDDDGNPVAKDGHEVPQ